MQYGLYLPNFGDFAHPRLLAELARDAEGSGWDGFFIWDHLTMNWTEQVTDATVTLAAIATATTRIRFGALVTAPPRRRPWKLARETVALDLLSDGRLTLGVGLGSFAEEFTSFAEPFDPKVRAGMLDESLDVLTGLWSGESFRYTGEYYSVREAIFLPRPVQVPRIPIWVAGTWPFKAPFRRSAHWDGVFPLMHNGSLEEMMPPDAVAAMLTYIRTHQTGDELFDVVHLGITTGANAAQAAQIIAPYATAGVTWWLENMLAELYGWTWGAGAWPVETMRERIRNGPPQA